MKLSGKGLLYLYYRADPKKNEHVHQEKDKDRRDLEGSTTEATAYEDNLY